jgi:hypothetical protein
MNPLLFACKNIYILLLVMLLSSPLIALSQEQAPDSISIYTVQPGDNLYWIARKYLPYTSYLTLPELVSAIRHHNNISENNIIFPGQNLKIPVIWEEIPATLDHINHETICGIYLNTYQLSTARLNEIISHYDSLGCNALVIDFKNENGEILYPSNHPLVREIGACNPIIASPQKLIHLLHEHDIMIVARLTMFKDPILAQARPEWAPQAINTLRQDTSEIYKTYPDIGDKQSFLNDTLPTELMDSLSIPDSCWVNPASPDAQRYNLEIIKEVVELGVDEIQLDYVRFPTEAHLLTANYNIPDSIPKYQIIMDFLKSAQSITKDAGITLSADIFGVVALQNEQDIINTGQNIISMVPYLDRIHPMVYPSHFFGEFWGKGSPEDEPYYFVYRSCQELINLTQQRNKIIPYLQAFSLNKSQINSLYIVAQLQAVKDCGLESGFLFWNAKGNYEPLWKALSLWKSGDTFFEYEMSDDIEE